MISASAERSSTVTTPLGDSVPERLARIETKMDLLLERTGEDRQDTGKRLRQLEHWRYGTGAAVIASIVSFVSGATPKG